MNFDLIEIIYLSFNQNTWNEEKKSFLLHGEWTFVSTPPI